MSAVRDLVEQDSWMPKGLTGNASKSVVVNAAEDGYELTQTGVVDIPTGVKVTGDVLGLDYEYTSSLTVTVAPGTCWDSLNTTILKLDSAQVVTLPSTTSNQFLFLCDDGTVQVDDNINGLTLLAGAVNQLRWIGYIKMHHTSTITQFEYSGETLTFRNIYAVPLVIPQLPTTYTQYSLTSDAGLPMDRLFDVSIFGGAGLDNISVSISIDGTNEIGRLTDAGYYPFQDGWYLKAPISNTDVYVGIFQVKLLR